MSRAGLLGVAVIAIIAGSASWLASSSPDGLNRVATDLGFAQKEQSEYTAPLPGYEVPGVSPRFSGAAAGLLGTVLVFGLAWGAGRFLVKRRAP